MLVPSVYVPGQGGSLALVAAARGVEGSEGHGGAAGERRQGERGPSSDPAGCKGTQHALQRQAGSSERQSGSADQAAEGVSAEGASPVF